MNILLVEQNNSVEDLLWSQLQELGYPVTDIIIDTCNSFNDAKKELTKNDYDLTLFRFDPVNSKQAEFSKAIKSHFGGTFMMAHFSPDSMIMGRQKSYHNENDETESRKISTYNQSMLELCYLLQKKSFDEKFDSSAKQLFVKSDSKLLKLDFIDIQWIEAKGDYLCIKTKDRLVITHSTMKNMEKSLPYGEFIRIHRSFIVNVNYITAVHHSIVEIDQKMINLGETYKLAFFKSINKL